MFLILLDLLDHIILTKCPHAMMNSKLQNKVKWIKACKVNNEWSWLPSIYIQSLDFRNKSRERGEGSKILKRV